MTKMNKLSEYDKLQFEKIRLRAAIANQAKVLDDHLEYMQHNIGSLLMNSGVSAVKSRLPQGIKNMLFPAPAASPNQAKTPKQTKIAGLLEIGKAFLPIVFSAVKPMLISFLIEKATGAILGNKKKINRKI